MTKQYFPNDDERAYLTGDGLALELCVDYDAEGRRMLSVWAYAEGETRAEGVRTYAYSIREVRKELKLYTPKHLAVLRKAHNAPAIDAVRQWLNTGTRTAY